MKMRESTRLIRSQLPMRKSSRKIFIHRDYEGIALRVFVAGGHRDMVRESPASQINTLESYFGVRVRI